MFTFSQSKTLHYHFLPYDIAKGLSSYNVQRVIQDKLGFTWIATQDGLNHFDGQSFKIFRNHGDYWKKIGDNVVVDLCTQPKTGDIYICLPYRGIEKINPQTLAVQTVMDEKAIAKYFTSDLITNISFDSSGKQLWIGGDGSFAVISIQTGALLYASKNDPRLALSGIDRIKKIISTNHGITYVLSRNGKIFVYETASLLYKSTISVSTATIQVNDACLVEKNKICLATSGGLINIDFPLQENAGSNGESIRAIHKDQQNNIWYATGEGLFRQTAGFSYRIQPTEIESRSWLTTINSIGSDQFGNLWIGSKQGVLLSVMSESAFQPYSIKDQSATGLGHIYNLLQETAYSLLLSTEDGLFRLNLVTGTTEAIGDKTVAGPAFPGPQNELLVSLHNSIYEISKTDHKSLLPAEKKYPVLSDFKNDLLGTYLCVGDSIILLGSDKENGLYCWNYKKNTFIHLLDNGPPGKQLGTNIVNCIRLMPTNEIFIGGDKNITLLNLASLTTKVVSIKAANKEPFKYYFDFHAAKGNYYISTHQRGIIVTDQAFNIKHLLSTENGLTDNGVYCILPEGDSAIWISSNNGLTRVSLSNNSCRRFFTKDGLHHNSFEEFSSTINGASIYFGGVGGITRVDPGKLNTTPAQLPVYFTNCTMSAPGKQIDTVITGLTELQIPATINQTNVNFAAIHYPALQDIYYQYSFSPNETNWLANGHQNAVTLMGMSPGVYKLAIRASLNNKDWTAPQILQISVLPKWFQTTLFKIGVALTGFAFIFLFYWNRVKQLEAQQNIRREIASDLHDDLGSTLNSIKVMTHLAKSDPRHLDQIETSLSIASGGLRDMIWVLDDTGDSWGELASRISKTVLPTLTAMNINFLVEMSHDLREEKITKLEKKNILLIIKEAINNSVKYAQCKNIILQIQKPQGKLVFSVADDGIGFSESSVKQGYGLQNMKNRAHQIGCNIQVISNSGHGTTIIASPSS